MSTEARAAKVDILERFAHRFPSLLVDAIAEHEPGKRLVAFKNVTVNEEFFQGHFPHKPLMPAVLMIEALTQAATLLLLDEVGGRAGTGVQLRGVDGAKFTEAYKSFGVSTKLTRGKSLSNAYKIDSVPTIGIHGRYFTSASLAGSNERALQVADQLIARTRQAG